MDERTFREVCEEVERARERGVSFVCLGEPDYPARFYDIDDPPLVLAYRGDLRAATARDGLAVVGGRNPGSESLEWLEVHLGDFVRRAGAPVISGGAFGIDRKAHFVAIKQQAPTICFLPSGIVAPYPAVWALEETDFLASGGVLVSEFLPNTAVARWHFVRRNRLISAIARAVFVVDAGRRSGTLLTARIALDQGRPICVLPGHPLDPRAHGSLDLLREGAPFVRHSWDLLEFFKAECPGPALPLLELASGPPKKNVKFH